MQGGLAHTCRSTISNGLSDESGEPDVSGSRETRFGGIEMIHRLVLYETVDGKKSVLDIVEWKGEPRFDQLIVLLRKAYQEMHAGRASDGVLELRAASGQMIPVTFSKGYEAKETWVRNTLLDAINKLTARL